MSFIQGRNLNSIADQITQIEPIKNIYEPDQTIQLPDRTRENLDELLNFIKLKHYLLNQGFLSFHLKIAPNTYYSWELGTLTRAKKSISSCSLCRLSL